MNIEEKIDALLRSTLSAEQGEQKKEVTTSHKPKLEFSKWLMLFAVILCAGTWVVAAASWVLLGEFPAELVQYTAWFFGALIAYMGKSAYENKPKILKGQGGGGK